jgi:hypothetical protein
MRYNPPTLAEFDHFRGFLLRDARETFGPEADAGRVFDCFAFEYDQYPRYGRLKDVNGQALVLGDRFFRLAELTNLFLAATQLGHDRHGILGERVTRHAAAVIDIEMSEDEFDALLAALGAVVHEVDPDLVIEFDWMEIAERGPALTPRSRRPAFPGPPHAAPGVIAVRDLGITKVALVKMGGGVVLDVEGEQTPLSAAEAEIFLNRSDAQLLDYVLGPEVDRDARLGELLTRGLREHLDYVFMDQSTFRNALRAIEDDALTPTRLFDLSALAHHLVFADAIAVPSSCPVPELLDGVVVRTTESEARFGPAIYTLSNPNGFRPEDDLEADGLKQIEAAWSAFLGVDVSLNYFHVTSATTSPGSWEYVVGDQDGSPDPAELLLAGTGTSDVAKAASIHTLRYIVNERRAQLMGIPYAASALRYPVQAVRMRNGAHFRSVVDHLLRPGGPPAPHGAPPALLDHLRLPDALGVAYATARDRSEIVPRALELRETMTSFREAMYENQRIHRPATEIIRALQRPVAGLTFARTTDAAIAQLSSVATTTGSDLATALLVTKLTKPLNLAERATRFVDLVRRPHIRVLQRFATRTADGATTDDLARLWDTRRTRRWFATLTRLSDLSAYESAKLHRF